jgi:putative membrane protein
MNLQYPVAVIHLLTFGIGFASCWARARAFTRLKDESGLRDVFFADNLWGMAALLWIGTGLWRAFGGLEKGTEFYIHNTAFLIKMGLFLTVFALEIRPMVTLIRWRIRRGAGKSVDLSPAKDLARISYIELILLIPIVMMATAVARGIWY